MRVRFGEFMLQMKKNNRETIRRIAKEMKIDYLEFKEAENRINQMPEEYIKKICTTTGLSPNRQEDLFKLYGDLIEGIKIELDDEEPNRKALLTFLIYSLQDMEEKELEELASNMKAIKNRRSK